MSDSDSSDNEIVGGKKHNPWIEFLSVFRHDNPNMKGAELFKAASAAYNDIKSTDESSTKKKKSQVAKSKKKKAANNKKETGSGKIRIKAGAERLAKTTKKYVKKAKKKAKSKGYSAGKAEKKIKRAKKVARKVANAKERVRVKMGKINSDANIASVAKFLKFVTATEQFNALPLYITKIISLIFDRYIKGLSILNDPMVKPVAESFDKKYDEATGILTVKGNGIDVNRLGTIKTLDEPSYKDWKQLMLSVVEKNSTKPQAAALEGGLNTKELKKLMK